MKKSILWFSGVVLLVATITFLFPSSENPNSSESIQQTKIEPVTLNQERHADEKKLHEQPSKLNQNTTKLSDKESEKLHTKVLDVKDEKVVEVKTNKSEVTHALSIAASLYDINNELHTLFDGIDSLEIESSCSDDKCKITLSNITEEKFTKAISQLTYYPPWNKARFSTELFDDSAEINLIIIEQ